MKKIITALVTPFTSDYKIDYDTLKIYIDYQLDDVDGFIVCGTTAEVCTLSDDEKFELLEFVLRICPSDKEIYFGCGTNNTTTTLALAKKASNYPINGLLIVTPYYNKPSQKGLYKHYECIAQAVSLPIILYQVESRCNCILEIETIKKLHHNHLNIIGIKYASSSIETLKEIRKQVKNFTIYCGDDALLYEMNPYIDGVISVLTHLYAKNIRAFFDTEDKREDFFIKRYSRLLFIESNPVPVKYVLSKLLHGGDFVRLPLATIGDDNKKLIDAYFDNLYDGYNVSLIYESNTNRRTT